MFAHSANFCEDWRSDFQRKRSLAQANIFKKLTSKVEPSPLTFYTQFSAARIPNRLNNAELSNVKLNPHQGGFMDNIALIGMISIFTAGLTISIGSIGPAFGEGRAVAQALSAIAQQPDESATITRTLFVGLAMIESTAIYCFVVAMILIFANPFWDHAIALSGG